ncbi:MAG: methylphosphotriester-DNA--protein-cysteine methyltransferase family protein [Planctomycetes bacterium]|nr:methylphosphotriester-DNA--protein-cysteine methyltransferase family protein [Planctomycetota bacterium]
MQLDADICYAALLKRDRRFDGQFFVAVKTTRIYCRPICPARTAKRENVTFYATAAEAQRGGFVPCLRCRPDLAPGSSSVDAKATLAKRATAVINKNWRLGVETLAATLGVTARHLRRALHDELGIAPLAFLRTQRLAVAKRLLRETNLTVARVAFASGFNSVRRFNAAFRQHVGHAPNTLRRP